MTIRIASFDPYTASDQLWAAFNETRRAIAREGYVNLLFGGSRQPAAGGDSSLQLRHRAQFLGAGHLDALTTTMSGKSSDRPEGLGTSWMPVPVRAITSPE